ncbi:hypothetical protein ALP98_102741 [Pseudomonas viridiflava]|uniref:Uncharacterized protein n=3 Tax=Pseudomonas syringae group TaxID=136849 RepID=A0A3M4P6N8_PSEVI|nr:hypothetical protein ALQ30_102165 [Pseudomonas syringae pv. persicae]RMP84353.1 hypothetical protein ALQ15_114630 [Pseudomonas syringae pv. actinidiae]RMQ14254.1 hypothetical protein ALQ09_101895 [Pseudomonas viridiflava]RMQ73897.1 hypothetical protein ALP98_102741 [Pseudomonas viridiflava]
MTKVVVNIRDVNEAALLHKEFCNGGTDALSRAGNDRCSGNQFIFHK